VNYIAKTAKPQYMLLFYVAPKQKNNIQKNLKELAQANKHLTVLVAGNMDLFQNNKSVLKNVTYLNDVSSLSEYLIA
jgi:hypothetical protein